MFERGDLVFVFNFHPENTYEGYAMCVHSIYVWGVYFSRLRVWFLSGLSINISGIATVNW